MQIHITDVFCHVILSFSTVRAAVFFTSPVWLGGIAVECWTCDQGARWSWKVMKNDENFMEFLLLH